MEMNPSIRDYLLQKKKEREALDQSLDPSIGQRIAAPLAAISAGFMGRDPLAAGQMINENAVKSKQAALNNFDKSMESDIQGIELGRNEDKYNKEQKSMAEDSDPNSQQSKLAQQVLKSMNMPGDLSGLTYEKFKTLSPVVQKKYEIEQKRIEDNQKKQENNLAKQTLLNDKMSEKMLALDTPVGTAKTALDATTLKSGYEAKQQFDNMIGELIGLREKHGGGALLNREDIGRAKQLSKDLLLKYKDMAKLGVLSQSDEKILNEIIPSDPLQYNSPLAAIQGQDPTLHKLKKFKEDAEKDFNTRVKTRTREGTEKIPMNGKVKVSNGSEVLEIDPSDLEDAIKDGYKKV